MDIEVAMVQLRQWYKSLWFGIKSVFLGYCPRCGNSDKTKIKLIGTNHNQGTQKYCRKCRHQW